MSTTPDQDWTPPEIQQAITRRMTLFYEEHIKPTARASAGRSTTRAEEQDRGDECRCKTPIPKHTSDNVHICARCGSVLKVDGEHHPYRRFPGDLDTPDMLAGRKVLELAETSRSEMAALVATLPEAKQRALMKLKGKKFQRVARHMIKVHLAMQQSEHANVLGPNARRRQQKVAERFASIVDERMRNRRDEMQAELGDVDELLGL